MPSSGICLPICLSAYLLALLLLYDTLLLLCLLYKKRANPYTRSVAYATTRRSFGSRYLPCRRNAERRPTSSSSSSPKSQSHIYTHSHYHKRDFLPLPTRSHQDETPCTRSLIADLIAAADRVSLVYAVCLVAQEDSFVSNSYQ